MRARADRVEEFLERQDIDVLTIQETKCKDENFPWEVFENNGYDVAHFGFNQWNGVAIASRVGMKDVERTFPNQPPFGKGGKNPVQEARAIGATCDGVRIWSLYVPNGRTREDEHMVYKLAWLRQLREHAESWLTEAPEKEGMRIDFVLASPKLAERVEHAFIDREERKGKGASDHAPVIVDLA